MKRCVVEMKSQMSQLLVIGYGNTLRRDDGVGVKVAEAVGALNLPGVKVMTRHQLVPELAEEMSQARAVIFVDANAKATGNVKLRSIKPANVNQNFAHATDPRSLLALSRQVFGQNPKAWMLAIPAEDFGFGDGLSPRAEAGLKVALEQIRQLTIRESDWQNKFCEAVGNFG